MGSTLFSYLTVKDGALLTSKNVSVNHFFTFLCSFIIFYYTKNNEKNKI